MLAPTALRRKVRGAKYSEANDPETEIWRARQRSVTWMGVGLLLAVECLRHPPNVYRCEISLALFCAPQG